MKQAGGKCVLACEINEESRKTYLANHDMTGVPFAADITQLEAALVPDHDVLCAGFPCQSFSSAGSKYGFDDQRGNLIFHMLRIIEAKRPKLLLLENVKNFCSGEGGMWSRTLRRRLAGMGYAVTAKVLNAAHFGTAQERERVFFVAYRRDAFADVQGFQMPVGDGKWISVADILEADAPDGHYTADQIEPCPTVDKSSPLQRVGMLKGRDGKVRHGQDARVYDPAFHATTLMATQDNCGVYLVNGKARSLTPRERARLQGFPETFKPHPVKTHANKQFGNSIAVPVAAAIGHAINQQFFNQAA
jgi:DNA (cytosine-5)-methyltransferase 1